MLAVLYQEQEGLEFTQRKTNLSQNSDDMMNQIVTGQVLKDLDASFGVGPLKVRP